MRKWSVATTLVVVAFFAVPTAAGAIDGTDVGGATASNAPQCPITEDIGITIVPISSELMLAWDSTRASAGPIAVALPAGTYGVLLVSWDAHSTKTDQSQSEEQWYLELWGGGTEPMIATGATPDLPDDLDMAAYDMGTVTITQPLTAVRAVHAAFPDEFEPHSVAPLCVAFLGTETSSTGGAGPDGTNGNNGQGAVGAEGDDSTNGTGTTGQTGGTTDENGTAGNNGDTAQTGGTTGGDTAATGGTTTSDGDSGAIVTGSGADEVGVLSVGPDAQSLQQLPLTGIQVETGFVAVLAILLGILLLRKSHVAQARLQRRNARVWRRPIDQ